MSFFSSPRLVLSSARALTGSDDRLYERLRGALAAALLWCTLEVLGCAAVMLFALPYFFLLVLSQMHLPSTGYVGLSYVLGT